MQQMGSEQRLIGSRVLNEIRARGYEGSPAAFYRAWARLRPAQPDLRITERFETTPGVQSQFDWSDYTVQLGSALTRVVMYETILSYSRRLHYSASLDATQASIFEALEEAFWHFGGVTKTLVVDNPRAFVLDVRPSHFQWNPWNPQFLALCGHYRLEPIACQPGRPRTKGKAERPFTTSSSISSRATPGGTSRTSARTSRASRPRCWTFASTTPPIRRPWNASPRRRHPSRPCRPPGTSAVMNSPAR